MVKPMTEVMVGRPTKTSDRGGRSRRAIFASAAQLFRKNGYASVSLRNIAAGAGMKAGSIYHHFESKERIVEEILNTGIGDVFDHVRQSVEALAEDVDHPTRIRAAITAHLEALHASSDYTSAYVRIFWQLPDSVRRGTLKVRLAYEDYWRNLLETANNDGCLRSDVNLTIFRLFLLGALNASLEWFDPDVGGVDAVAEDYANLLLKGLISEPGDHQP